MTYKHLFTVRLSCATAPSDTTRHTCRTDRGGVFISTRGPVDSSPLQIITRRLDGWSVVPEPPPNKSLDASRGSVFRMKLL